MKIKPKILILSPYYLPGYKSGGALRTIANMVDQLNDEFEFWIVTRDRDIGDTSPYPDIQSNQWQRGGNAMIYYLPPKNCTVRGMVNLISDTPHDVLYFNSYFEPVFTLKPLLARRLGWLPNKPVIVAPRGEFSTGAKKIKYFKKCVYIKISKIFQIYNNVIWQASSDYEAHDIFKVLNENPKSIHVALDLPVRVSSNTPVDMSAKPIAAGAGLKIVFLSRISPIKNLDYALRVLSKVKASVLFDIYGPIEDLKYWEFCKKLMTQLPQNVSVNYMGSVHPEEVAFIFSRYDLFFFPTHGENYGHVIAESLSVGTPVLLSDQTPWRHLQSDRMGWDLSLDDMGKFIRIVDTYSDIAVKEKIEWRELILRKIIGRLTNPQIFKANRKLFRRAIQN